MPLRAAVPLLSGRPMSMPERMHLQADARGTRAHACRYVDRSERRRAAQAISVSSLRAHTVRAIATAMVTLASTGRISAATGHAAAMASTLQLEQLLRASFRLGPPHAANRGHAWMLLLQTRQSGVRNGPGALATAQRIAGEWRDDTSTVVALAQVARFECGFIESGVRDARSSDAAAARCTAFRGVRTGDAASRSTPG